MFIRFVGGKFHILITQAVKRYRYTYLRIQRHIPPHALVVISSSPHQAQEMSIHSKSPTCESGQVCQLILNLVFSNLHNITQRKITYSLIMFSTISIFICPARASPFIISTSSSFLSFSNPVPFSTGLQFRRMNRGSSTGLSSIAMADDPSRTLCDKGLIFCQRNVQL